jgi:hypothetical protein
VDLDRTADGKLVYVVDNKVVLDPSQVLHFNGLALDGLCGLSVISQHRNAVQLGKSQEAYGTSFFGRGPMPGGVLQIQGKPSEDERKQMIASFQKTYGGARNAGRTVLLTAGMSWTPITISNQDAEFLQSREFQDEQIARIFGVPPSLIGIQGKSSYASQEQDSIMFVRNCLRPLAERFEQEVNCKLLGASRPYKWVKINLNALQRGDSVSQATMLSTLHNSGLITTNEGREEFDLNPVELGDVPLVQGAMVSLERAVEGAPTSTTPPPPTPPEETDQEGGTTATEDDGDVEAAGSEEDDLDSASASADDLLARLLTDCYARLLRVAGDKAERAQKKGELAEHLQAFYGPPNVQYVVEAVTPLLQFWAVAVRRPDLLGVASAAEAIALEYDAESLQVLQKASRQIGVDLSALQDKERPVRFARRSVVIAKEKLKRAA